MIRIVIAHETFHAMCDELAVRDADLHAIITAFGYPPLWSRPNTFESLVHIIFEQQVSLTSALITLEKLRSHIGAITPELVLTLSDEAMKACYVSRQKSGYIRGLAHALLDGSISLQALEQADDEMVRRTLTKLKGIGNWTADIYLIFVLHRADVFPLGDLAAVNALRSIKHIRAASQEEVVQVTETWQPYRTIATMLLWHHYLSKRKFKLTV